MEHQHGWLTVTCDAQSCIAQIEISPVVKDVVAALSRAGWRKYDTGTVFCPTHSLSGMHIVLSLQLDNIHHEVQQMAQTIDELKTLVQAFNATLTADVSAATQAIADLKQQIADLKTPSLDFQPELDAANAQLAALEAATANAKS